MRELDEQIQSDDRAERLEATLQNTQNRADELEFQLSKLQQAHNALKAEREELDTRLQRGAEAEAVWKNRYAEIERKHATAEEQLSTTSAERDALLQDKLALQSNISGKESAAAELERKLVDVAVQLANSARQLQQTQAELRGANKRAEEAERTQNELRGEGVGLMRSLDEMRNKVIELTDEKVNLAERVDGLEGALQNRDSTIAQLESTVEELRNEQDLVRKECDEVAATLEKERAFSNQNSSELQQAYTTTTKWQTIISQKSTA